jgi:hypothetical protein
MLVFRMADVDAWTGAGIEDKTKIPRAVAMKIDRAIARCGGMRWTKWNYLSTELLKCAVKCSADLCSLRYAR